MAKGVLLGFEVGTGDPVYVDPYNLIVAGQTRMAGKTVTLNALNSRSGRRTIAFRTKRGETTFDAVNILKPFYKEPKKQRSKYISWQYVKSILEASQGRGMNFEEAWIIRSCDGATTLREVYENIKHLQGESRKGIDENQYLKLMAYFDIILPQLEEREYATTIKLKKGINLMDLEALTFEMRCLVMERTITHVMERMKNVVIMLPEGWKYVPEKLTTPVKASAILLAREGSSIQNNIWIDSQDLRGVDKVLVGQCSTWLLGVQVEANEAKRTRTSLGNRVKVSEIQGLKLGHFYVRNKNNELTHTYALPAGVPEEMGIRVAKGEIPPEVVQDYLAGKTDGDEEEMYKRKYEELKEEHSLLQERHNLLMDKEEAESTKDPEHIRDLEERIDSLENSLQAERDLTDQLKLMIIKLEKTISEKLEQRSEAEEAIENLRKILNIPLNVEVGVSGKKVVQTDVLVEHELTGIEVKYVKQTIETNTNTLLGRMALLYAQGTFNKDTFYKISDIMKHFESRGWGGRQPKASEILRDMTKMGFWEMRKIGNRPEFKPTMTADEAEKKGLLKVNEVLE